MGAKICCLKIYSLYGIEVWQIGDYFKRYETWLVCFLFMCRRVLKLSLKGGIGLFEGLSLNLYYSLSRDTS